jgi:DNA-binding MltR family transcriptional regulator
MNERLHKKEMVKSYLKLAGHGLRRPVKALLKKVYWKKNCPIIRGKTKTMKVIG